MSTRVIFVRHAEAAGNFLREFHGFTDQDITEKGHKQAKLVGDRLENIQIDIMYCSSMKRTEQTARYIFEKKNLTPIFSENLKEIFGGDWEGRKWDVLESLWPQEYYNWEEQPHLLVMPNGESMKDFQHRLIVEVNQIVRSNKGQNICIVTHGTAIKTLLCYFKGFELSKMSKIPWCDNTAVTIVDFDNDNWNIVIESDSSHLPRELSTVYNQEWWDEYSKKLNENEK